MKRSGILKVLLVATLVFLPTFVKAQNLVTDSSWESGKIGEWKLDGSAKDCYIEDNKSNAHSGKFTYKYWKAQPFKSTLTRTITSVPDGNYTLSIWAMGGGGENEIRFFAKDKSGKEIASTPIKNTGWKNWKCYSVDVPVKGGEITIGIYVDANKDNWGNFDDVVLEKK